MRSGSTRAGDEARWRMLALLAAILILSMTTWFSATAVLPDLERAFSLTSSAASWLTNAVQAGFVVAALTLGISGLADAVPAHILLAGAAALAAVSNLALLAAPNAAALFAARVVTGIALAGVYPTALKMIATWFARGRGLAMGAAVGALTLGSSTPYLVRAVGAALDWRAVVAASSVAAVISVAATLLVRPGPYGAARHGFDPSRLGVVARNPALVLANLGYFGHMWELYAMWGWFLAWSTAAAAARPLGISAPLLTFLVIAIGAFGCLAGGLAADRIGRTALTASAMAVSGLCCVAAGAVWGGPPALLAAVALVWGFAVIADSAQFSAMATELADPTSVGTALTLQVGGGFALTIVSIRLLPLVAGAFGWRWSFLVLAPGPLVGALAMLALRAHPCAEAIAGGRR